MATEEETLITRLVVEGEEAIERAKTFTSTIEQLKTQIKDLSAQSGQSFRAIAEGMNQIKTDQVKATREELGRLVEELRTLREAQKEGGAIFSAEQQAAYTEAVKATRVQVDELRNSLKEYKAQLKGEDDRQKQEQLRQDIKNTEQAIKDATRALADFRAEQKKEAADPAREAQTREEIKQTEAAIRAKRLELQKTREEATRYGKDVGTALSEVTKEAKSAGQGFKVFGYEIKNVGDIAKLVFTGIFGVTVLGILRQLINYLKEAVKAGQEFARSMYLLEVGVRALQRAGIEITIKDVYEQIDRLGKRFGIFSKVELVQGTASLLNLIRDLGFTREQIFKLQDAIATLATVNGRAMDEVQKTVALAISSGYTEGLQRLGVSINRVNIAQQAMTMGFEGGYMALTEQQRSAATYVLILEKVAKYQEDLLEYQRTLPGQIDKTTKAIEAQSAVIGDQLLPAQLELKKAQQGFLDGLSTLIYHFTTLKNAAIYSLEEIKKAIFGLFPAMQGLSAIADLIGEKLSKSFDIEVLQAEDLENITAYIESLQNMLETRTDLTDTQRAAIEDQIRAAKAFLGQNYDEMGDTIVESEQALTDRMVALIEDRLQEIEDMEAESAERRKELALDLARELEAIERGLAYRITEINIDLQNKINKIVRDTNAQINEAQARYAMDVQQVLEKYYAEVQEAQIKHNEKSAEIEQDYLEKIRRLREDFLLNIEDAIRERDAKQVLQLVRRYELDKDRAKRERDDALADEATRYQDELRNLDQQRDERLRRLKQELDMRTAMLREQQKREIAEARIKAQQQREEERRQAQQQKNEREIRNKQELDDLDAQIAAKAQKLAEAFAAEFGTNQENFQKLYELAKQYFGENGYLEQVFKYYRQMITQYLAFVSQFTKSMPNTLTKAGQEEDTETGPYSGPHAQGGVEYFKSPTIAKFGEVPEVVTFTPISNSSQLSSVLNEIRGRGGIGGGQSSAAVEIFLEAGLTAKIIDAALGETANIIVHKMGRQ